MKQLIKKSSKQPKSDKPTSWRSRLLEPLLLTLWAGISVIVAQFIVSYPMIWVLGKKVNQPVWMTVYTALAYLVAMLLCILLPHFLLKKFRTKREELGLTGLPTWTDIGLAPIGLIVYFLLATALVAFFTFLSEQGIFPWFDASEAQEVGFSNLYASFDRIVAFTSLVVIAPIAEEVIFRGWLYGKLRARLSLVPAILLTSILFGAVHGQWNVGINVFAMSIIMCLQREITGTVYSGIILHMIKNGIAFYLLYILGVG